MKDGCIDLDEMLSEIAELKKENAELRAKESFVGDQNRKLCEQQQKIEVLEAENAELKKQLTELKEFYEIEYFQIADRTADEKIKELEKHQVEVTVDDYSPYDENTWGMMHEEWFVPKEEVRDLLKENYALITKAKDLLKQWLQTSKASGCDNFNIVTDTEQFLNSEV